MTTATDLESILYQHDAIGLRSAGAPADEYRQEAETIAARLGEAASAKDGERILHEEFVVWFTVDIAGDSSTYEAAAREVWESLRPQTA